MEPTKPYQKHAALRRRSPDDGIPPLYGLVLSGGHSTRMGMDKGSIQYHANKTQREYLYELLQPFCTEVFISCNASQTAGVQALGLPVITDSFLELGPTGGILSAFRENPNAAWLVVACDLPYLSTATLQYLVEHRDAGKIATAFSNPDSQEWPEPLITIWEPDSYAVLLQWLAKGYSCPRKALINSSIALLQTPDKAALQNVNSYNDYLITSKNGNHV